MGRPKLAQPTYQLKPNRHGYQEISWTEDGRTRRVSTGTTDPAEAAAFQDRFLAGRAVQQPPAEPSITDIHHAYEADRAAKVAAPERIKYAGKPLVRLLGNLEPRHISQSVIDDYADGRQKEHIGDGTIIKELGTLRASLFWAERNQWIDRAPRFEMPRRRPSPHDRWLTREEAAKVMEHTLTAHAHLFIVLALTTAARRQAIIDLEWEQVRWHEGVIDFGRGHGNKRRAKVPINDSLATELRQAETIATTKWVVEFNGEQAGNPRHAVERAYERAGLSDVPRKIHTLRHTAATWMVMAGRPLREVARYLGTTEDIVERVYGHHAPDYLRAAASALEL